MKTKLNMEYFDRIINRKNTHCLKYDWRNKLFTDSEVIPLWVADMDFGIADEIRGDIINRTNHGIFGYTYHYDELYKAVSNWVKKRYNQTIEKEWIIFYHGVMPSVSIAISEFTNPGDRIIVQPPVYTPLFQTIKDSNREVVYNKLKIENGNYSIDFEDLERQIDDKTKMLLFCHPHNPTGRNWTREELATLDSICRKHDIMVVSDEIHCDIIYPDSKHIPYITISRYAEQNTISCISPSKTFNIAGLAISAMIIPNKKIFSVVEKSIHRTHLYMLNLLGMIALESAYTKADEWLNELLKYLQGNRDFMIDYIGKNIPGIKCTAPQATYLAWLNCKNLNMNNKELKEFMIREAKVGLSDGSGFGTGGEGFQRLNFACPRSVLKQAFEQIKNAVNKPVV